MTTSAGASRIVCVLGQEKQDESTLGCRPPDDALQPWPTSTGSTHHQVAQALGITGKTVRRWRSRWNESFEALVALESKRKAAAFRRDLEHTLSDAPRSGAPPSFSPETVCQIIALACEDPARSGRPVTTWTGRELADECIKRKIAPSISANATVPCA